MACNIKVGSRMRCHSQNKNNILKNATFTDVIHLVKYSAVVIIYKISHCKTAANVVVYKLFVLKYFWYIFLKFYPLFSTPNI
jgi:hypothetical protein